MSHDAQFKLDEDSNPHPRMLEWALRHRAAARGTSAWSGQRVFFAGYLAAMSDATGCTENDLEAWMDRHEATP